MDSHRRSWIGGMASSARVTPCASEVCVVMTASPGVTLGAGFACVKTE